MEPWFDAITMNRIGGLIGTTIGFMGAIIGCSTALFVRHGWRKAFYSVYFTIFLLCCGLLITGLVALFQHQPYPVWYGFLLPGLIGAAIVGGLFPVIRKRFTDYEILQMQSRDVCDTITDSKPENGSDR